MKSYLKKTFILSVFSIAVITTSSAKANVNLQLSEDTTMMQRHPAKPTDISPLLIGECIPTIKIPATDGKLFDLNASITQKPTILVFYRGGWCPFCNKELSGLQTIQEDLVKQGYQIIAISTDSPENLSKSITKHKLNYTLLSDADLNVSKQFGIAYQAPKNYAQTITMGSGGKNVDKLLPVPSVFILDQKGAIQFEYINPDFTQRISPKVLQSVAAAIKADQMNKSNEGN